VGSVVTRRLVCPPPGIGLWTYTQGALGLTGNHVAPSQVYRVLIYARVESKAAWAAAVSAGCNVPVQSADC
jgi:hypothetical protein